jgi:hypothetical protein
MSGYYYSSFLVVYDTESITKTCMIPEKIRNYPPTQPLSVLIYLVIRFLANTTG